MPKRARSISKNSLAGQLPQAEASQVAIPSESHVHVETEQSQVILNKSKSAPISELSEPPLPAPQLAFEGRNGKIYCGDSLQLLNDLAIIHPGSVNLIMTSPPFGLVRKKEYGNVDADKYTEWFQPFAEAFHKALADNGSLVIDIGGAWMAGQPTRSLYHYELLIMLCHKYHFHLAQEYYWWNPSKLPTPAEWVTVRRIRVKDAVNCVWWLSKTPWPKASNTRVLQPYSEAMVQLLRNGYKAKLRPSGHDISTKFSTNNGAAIPPNILAIPNTESNSAYLRYCTEHNLKMHPARYPAALPEYFIRMLTDPEDLVLDPFAGSCVTGEVAERLNRNWLCSELREDYVEGAKGRFQTDEKPSTSSGSNAEKFYKLARPGLLWNEADDAPLPEDGGKVRLLKPDMKKDSLDEDEVKATEGDISDSDNIGDALDLKSVQHAEAYPTTLW
jgi:DNA modification methylase